MRYFYALLTLLIFSCSDDGFTSKTESLRIDYYRPAAMGIAPQLVYRVQQGDDIGSDDWNFLYSGIDGFDYEPGYIYNLEVNVTDIANPLADGSSKRIELKNVVSKTSVAEDSTYTILIKRSSAEGGTTFVFGDAENGYNLANELEIDCNEICSDLEAAIKTDSFIYGTFQVQSNTSIKLISVENQD